MLSDKTSPMSVYGYCVLAVGAFWLLKNSVKAAIKFPLRLSVGLLIGLGAVVLKQRAQIGYDHSAGSAPNLRR